MGGKKHVTKSKLKVVSCFFQKVPVKEKNLNATNTRTLPNQAVPKKAILRCYEMDKTKAEIYWVLNVVANNYSLNLCDDKNCLFTAMFPDSEIS